VAIIVHGMLQGANLFVQSTILHLQLCKSISQNRCRREVGQLLGREAKHCLKLCDIIFELDGEIRSESSAKYRKEVNWLTFSI